MVDSTRMTESAEPKPIVLEFITNMIIDSKLNWDNCLQCRKLLKLI